MDANAERAAFELWAASEQLCSALDFEWQPERNCYAEFYVHKMWQAWRARAALHTAGPT